MHGSADDLAELIEELDLKDVTLVGHSTGGGEVMRYIGRHGTKRVASVVLGSGKTSSRCFIARIGRAHISKGTLDQFWLWSMQGGLKNTHESIKAFSESDFTEDLKQFDVPTSLCSARTTRSCRSTF